MSFLTLVCLFFATHNTQADSAFQGSKHDRCFSYFNDVISEKPWSIHVVRVDRHCPSFTFYTTLGSGDSLGMGIVSDQLKNVPTEIGQPIAAINGDFYDKPEGYEGRPRDIQISGGELVSAPSGHSSFWVDADGNAQMTNIYSKFRVVWADGKTSLALGLNEPREDDKAVLFTGALGRSTHTTGGMELLLEPTRGGAWEPLHVGASYSARIKEIKTSGDSALTRNSCVLSLGPQLLARLSRVKVGDTIQFSTETIPDLKGAEVAIGGGPALIKDHKLMEWKGYFHMRHPRSALGWNEKYFFMVEVDGRQSNSVGMTFHELADYMLKLGCDEALNFDGGGSATMWVLGSVRNSPSEGHERPSPNALVLIKKRTESVQARSK